jgi:hypothetical protein
MARANGKYFPETLNGQTFHGSTAAAGVAYPISTGTAATFGLWNTSQGTIAVLQRLTGAYTSGTIALGTVGLIHTTATQLATGSNITAFTDGVLGTTIRNGMLGQGQAPKCRFTPSAATIVASTACMWLGQGVSYATPADQNFSGFDFDFNGSIVLPYGAAVFVCNSVAQTGLFSMTLSWTEVPA